MSLKFFSSFTRPRFLNAAPADFVYSVHSIANRVFLFQELAIAVFAVEAIGGSKKLDIVLHRGRKRIFNSFSKNIFE